MVAPPTAALMTKSELRTLLRKRRRAFVEAEKSNEIKLEPALNNRFINLISKYKFITSYRASPYESDVMPLLLRVAALGDRLALPCVDHQDDPIIFRRWRGADPLVRSPLGIDQPEGTAPAVEPDLILVPLIGFDRALNRLGQGAGHYDRAFAALPGAHRIGIAWSCQQVDALPTDPWDIPLDAVLTENAWISAPNSRIERDHG